MESALKRLFDFQKFERNADLQRVIDGTHSRYAVRKLSMDELDFVAAAGTPDPRPEKKGLEKKNNGN